VGARVYLFKGSGGYLGHYADTDDQGHAEFELPDRQYKFRVDWEGGQYWSGPITVIPHQVNEIDMDLDLLGFNLTGERRYANNNPKDVLSALAGFPYSFFVSSVIAAPGVSETIYYYHNDHLGTPQVLTDDQGQIVWKGDYRPFGEVDIVVEEVGNDFRFPGQYFDKETGLHYNYYRYYHSDIGRYLRTDPIGFGGGDVNLYAYVANNPVNFVDPMGLQKECGPCEEEVFSGDKFISCLAQRGVKIITLGAACAAAIAIPAPPIAKIPAIIGTCGSTAALIIDCIYKAYECKKIK
jgi:RHS repeat-associated protein